MSNVSHRLPIRIYYEDTDFSGVVYHASYLRFLERGRTEVLRDLGVHQAALHGDEGALAFVVRRMTIDWLKPARMDDLVTVETWVDTLRGASLLLGQRIMLGDTVLFTAEVLVALVQNGKAARLTQALREKLGSNQA
ncbi:MAG: tol-pal system-associated acyl-CoA thioesterase [Alphaproteobacteria bacterium]|nr:tol-pal system-associated acyl-CoA thioesterase [Alphaproteobacteria bacterium]